MLPSLPGVTLLFIDFYLLVLDDRSLLHLWRLQTKLDAENERCSGNSPPTTIL